MKDAKLLLRTKLLVLRDSFARTYGRFENFSR